GMLLVLPDRPLLFAGIAVLGGLLPYAILRNYGMFSTFLTPLVLLLLELITSGGREAALTDAAARLVDTVIGCGVALLVGYALWPESWRSQLPSRVAAAAQVLGDYLAAAFRPDRSGARQLRRRTYRTLSDLRTAFQQTLSEPRPWSARAAAWWPVVAQLETVTDAVTAAAVAAASGGPKPELGHVDRCVAAVRGIAGRLREGTPPEVPDLEFPDDPPIQRIASGIRVSQRILGGPTPVRRRQRRRRPPPDGTGGRPPGLETDGPGNTEHR
ncbi:MAG: FUSC family protein, partial [Candidatus Dormibacteraceae bacterium]